MKPYDYSKINIVKQIRELKDYKGYKRILTVKPFINTYIGYMDGVFFGFTVPDLDPNEKDEQKKRRNRNLNFMEPEEAIDYYLNTFHEIFRNPALEYQTFYSRAGYRP